MTLNGMSDSLRAAILAAVAAFEQDEEPIRDLATEGEAWRERGRRIQINMRYTAGRTLPTLPFRRQGRSKASRSRSL